MPHVLFVYDRPDSLTTAPEETRQAVYREYQTLADIPHMVGHRLDPGDPGTILTVTDDDELPRLEPVVTDGLRSSGSTFSQQATPTAPCNSPHASLPPVGAVRSRSIDLRASSRPP
jgi:hypothetical protein